MGVGGLNMDSPTPDLVLSLAGCPLSAQVVKEMGSLLQWTKDDSLFQFILSKSGKKLFWKWTGCLVIDEVFGFTKKLWYLGDILGISPEIPQKGLGGVMGGQGGHGTVHGYSKW